VQSNLILWQRADLQFSGSYKSTDYDADYGLKDASTYDLNGSIGAQFSGAGYVTALFGYQSHHREVSSINVVRTASSDDSAGGPNYPLSNAWRQTVEDANYLAAVSVRQTLGPVSLDVGYTFFFADGDFAYAYAGPGAISNTLTAAQAGSAFPDQTFERHLVEANIVWPYSEKILLRGYYRFEQEALDDFHYDGLKNVVGNHLFLAAVPEAYTAHIVGLFGQYRF
jgi:hypothetical protein